MSKDDKKKQAKKMAESYTPPKNTLESSFYPQKSLKKPIKAKSSNSDSGGNSSNDDEDRN